MGGYSEPCRGARAKACRNARHQGGTAQAPPAIEYLDKPPCRCTAEGQQAGFLMERTVPWLKRAGIDPDDLSWLHKGPEFASLPLARIELAELARGELRYLVCSKQVTLQTMARFNQAVRDLGVEAQPG